MRTRRARCRTFQADTSTSPALVHALLAAGEQVATYSFDGVWFDIGTPADYDGAVAHMSSDGSTLLRGLTPTAVYPRPQGS